MKSSNILNKENLCYIIATFVRIRAITDYRNDNAVVGNLLLSNISYIAPRPQDVESLMSGILQIIEEALNDITSVDPIVLAAIISFGIAFIQPFQEENEKLHRFLIHYILKNTQFYPGDLILPISPTINTNTAQYHVVVQHFYAQVMNALTYERVDRTGFDVNIITPNTKIWYQYFDATLQTDYLRRIIETSICYEFKKQLDVINFLMQ